MWEREREREREEERPHSVYSHRSRPVFVKMRKREESQRAKLKQQHQPQFQQRAGGWERQVYPKIKDKSRNIERKSMAAVVYSLFLCCSPCWFLEKMCVLKEVKWKTYSPTPVLRRSISTGVVPLPTIANDSKRWHELWRLRYFASLHYVGSFLSSTMKERWVTRHNFFLRKQRHKNGNNRRKQVNCQI